MIPYSKALYNKQQLEEVRYYLTQFLSGYESFQAYLFRFKKSEAANCPECLDEEDNVTNVIFQCLCFQDLCKQMEDVVGKTINPNYFVSYMLEVQGRWNAVTTYTMGVTKSFGRSNKMKVNLNPLRLENRRHMMMS